MNLKRYFFKNSQASGILYKLTDKNNLKRKLFTTSPSWIYSPANLQEECPKPAHRFQEWHLLTVSKEEASCEYRDRFGRSSQILEPWHKLYRLLFRRRSDT